MHLSGLLVVFTISQTPWVLMYLIGSLSVLANPPVMVTVGVIVLIGLVVSIRILLPPTYKTTGGTRSRNFFYYMCCVFSWSCTIDLILYLEATNRIQGYMDFYLKTGEPYLGSPFGIAVNLWDAIIHLLLYLVIIYKYDNGGNYRDWGLYWNGSMFASMISLIIGSIVGSYGTDLHPAIFLNIPYIILPICSCVHLLKLKGGQTGVKRKSHVPSLIHYLLVFGMVFSILFSLLRGLGALGSPFGPVKHYLAEYEPYILEPGKFGTMHCIALFAYGIPIQAIAIYGSLNNNLQWIRDLSLLYAGFTAQGTYFHLVAQLYPETNPDYILEENITPVVALNLAVVFFAHLWVYCSSKQMRAYKTQ